METGEEIKQNLQCIRYYISLVDKLIKQQIDADLEANFKIGKAIDPESIRHQCLGYSLVNTEWLNIYCNNIEANIKHAEEQDVYIQKKEPIKIEQIPEPEQSKF